MEMYTTHTCSNYSTCTLAQGETIEKHVNNDTPAT